MQWNKQKFASGNSWLVLSVDWPLHLKAARVPLLKAAGSTVCFLVDVLASSQQDLQHALHWFSAACDRDGIKALKRPRNCDSPEKQASVCCKLAVIHCSRSRSSCTLGWYTRVAEGGTRRWIHGLVKQTRGLHRSVVTNREFQTLQSCQFWNRSLFRSSPMPWILGYDRKNTTSIASGRDGIFAMSPRCDTSWQSAQLWNS